MNTKQPDVKEIFCGALEKKSAAQRNAYLDKACKGDSKLRAEVEELLRAHNTAGGFLEPPVANVDVAFDDSPLTEGPGTKIGRYKLLELIGEGGFGVVYMAEQAEPIRRRVALKIIKLGMDTKQVIVRFEAERQALAMMDHPNIAKVLDAGATETGRPFFVMELVKGIPVTEYCDKNNLDTRQRLEIFIDVCKAVQHAHQKGIIHRDIKPTNILITLHDDGSPLAKVIDFGIAKATQKSLTEKTLFTEFKQFVGTPEYMSPEQAQMSAAEVDTRSDIYSLGVLLYELLTGRTPLEHKDLLSASYDQMLKIIRQTEPPKPSACLNTLGDALGEVAKHRQVNPSQLSKIISGDLDWIVLKTLEKDRARRYETANELARDIRRHLEDDPVVAGPPSTAYRLRKFVRRNRTVVAVVLTILLVLIIGLSLATVGFVQASQERNRAIAAETEAVRQRDLAQTQRERAELNFQKAREAVNEMTSVAEGLFNNRARITEVQRELLQKAQVFYKGFLEENRNNPAVRQETGRAYRYLGDTYESLGQSEQAVPAYEKSIMVFEELVADFPDEAEYKRQIAISNNYMGVALSSLRRFDEALAVYEKAVGLLEALMAEFGDEPEYMLPLSWVYRHRGLVFEEIGKVEEAEEEFRRTLQVRQKLLARNPDEPEYRRELALILGSLESLLATEGKCDEAEQAMRRAIEIMDKLATEFGEVPRHRYEMAEYHLRLGDLLKLTGRSSEAVDAYHESIRLSKQLTGEFPLEPAYRQQQGWSCHNLGEVLRISGQLEEARKTYHRAKQLFEKLAADFPEVADYQEGLGRAHAGLTELDKAVQGVE